MLKQSELGHVVRVENTDRRSSNAASHFNVVWVEIKGGHHQLMLTDTDLGVVSGRSEQNREDHIELVFPQNPLQSRIDNYEIALQWYEWRVLPWWKRWFIKEPEGT